MAARRRLFPGPLAPAAVVGLFIAAAAAPGVLAGRVDEPSPPRSGDEGGVDPGRKVESDASWPAAKGPYRLPTGLIIRRGATLAVEAGAVIELGPNADLVIADGGRLLAEGTAAAPIRFTSLRGARARWGGVIVNGSDGSPETRIRHATFDRNNFTAIYSNAGTVFLDHLRFLSADRQFLSLDGSSFVVSSSYFPTATRSFEPVHGTQGLKRGGRGIVRDCFFGGTIGYSDVIDFTGGNRDRSPPIIQFFNNVFVGSSDDHIDLDGTDAWVEGNIFLHAHKNGDTPDSSSAISGGNHRRNTSEVTIVGNLFFDCDQAVTAKEGNFFTMVNNTIVHMTNRGGVDTASGAVCVRDLDPYPTRFGRGVYLEANVIVDVPQLTRNYEPGQTTVTFKDNVLPSAWEGPGSGNLVVDPKLKRRPRLSETRFTSWEEAQVMREWLSLEPSSPAIGSGPNGRDRGGVIPLGASVSGEPCGTTDQTGALLKVGFNRRECGIADGGWPLGAGYTHYRWRLDGGAWSEEAPIDASISLSGLKEGRHRVEVIGKRDSGSYQDDPELGPDAIVTRSREWEVKQRPP